MSSYTKQREEFILACARAGIALSEARRILYHASTLQRLALRACERELTPGEQQRAATAERQVCYAAGRSEVIAHVRHDPEGACVVLEGPSLGGELPVPTRLYKMERPAAKVAPQRARAAHEAAVALGVDAMASRLAETVKDEAAAKVAEMFARSLLRAIETAHPKRRRKAA